MKDQDLKELLELEKKFYHKLTETIDLTRELAETAERQDQVSLQMMVSLRQKPLLELQEISSYIELKRVELSRSDADVFDRLVAGDPAQSPGEIPVADQIASNHRLLDRLVELDQQVNQKFCGDKSFYHP